MKQLRQCFFVQVGSNHAQAAGVVCTAVPHVDLAGHIVKLEPLAGRVLQDTLGAEDPAVFLFVGQLSEDGADLVFLVALRGFQADVAENFVCVMFAFAVVMVMMVMMLMVMIMVMMFMLFMIVVMVVMMFVFVLIIDRKSTRLNSSHSV